MSYAKKPGAAGRATVVFMLLNAPLVLTSAVVIWLSGGVNAEWYVRGILAVGFAVSEFAIVVNTIAPPMLDWIKSEEYVKDGEKPSWERNK
jgi:hypothetical protein